LEQRCFVWNCQIFIGLQVIDMATEMFCVNCPDENCSSFGREDEIEVDAESTVICGDCGRHLRDFPDPPEAN
jgi:uncharacterized CHY-type Zn-finger protein